MFKDFLLVGTGSFLGGGMRLLVSRLLAAWVPTPFPLGTFTTFMSEHTALVKDGQYFYVALYLLGSLALGLVAVLAGNQLAKLV